MLPHTHNVMGGVMGNPPLLSPRFQRHVHTYRILPNDEGLLSVQVGTAVGVQGLGATGVPSLPWLMPLGACLGAQAGCRCKGAGMLASSQHTKRWHPPALPDMPALWFAQAACNTQHCRM